ncbi:MarR family transcriptional regulator [Paenibacillus sp. FSL W8-0186]|uniref:MarR family winged helix-turn-helix transcriptional regulator n=1 Tax=Paenibacillus TaxID=44249 RepID=UPI0030CEFCD8
MHNNHLSSAWFGTWFRKISLYLTNIMDKILAQHGITSSQYWILKLLWEKEGVTQKQLVQHLGVRGASLTGMLDSMEARGWVLRKLHPKDARVKLVYLTPEGKALEAVVLDLIMTNEENLSKGFSEEEKVLLRSMLNRVWTNLEEAKKLFG